MATKDNPVSYITSIPNDQISFDVDAFDNFIRSQGVLFIHQRGMRCPVGVIDPNDQQRPHPDHSGCQNGFLYTVAGKVTALFAGNSMQASVQDVGVLDAASVSATFPRFYDEVTDCCEGPRECLLAPFDRLYLSNENIHVVYWQTFEASITGRDRLQFPAVRVQDLVDSMGIRYRQDIDFSVEEGRIVWLNENRPGLDPDSGKGRICSVRYEYRPHWYVKALVHDIRVSQSDNPVTGVRTLTRMPQAVQLQREYLFTGSRDNDPEAPHPDSLRQAPGPRDGSFNP